MITWSQTLEEGTIQLQVNSQPQWMEYIPSAGHTARWISTTMDLWLTYTAITPSYLVIKYLTNAE